MSCICVSGIYIEVSGLRYFVWLLGNKGFVILKFININMEY